MFLATLDHKVNSFLKIQIQTIHLREYYKAQKMTITQECKNHQL